MGDGVNWVDSLGFLASTAVLATFCMRRMITLRLAALASNLLFGAYGYVDHLLPVLLLHIARTRSGSLSCLRRT
jgi:CRP/FNR family cyclic AMP-dependent transcriptional regulator